jgi:hypothetical protein
VALQVNGYTGKNAGCLGVFELQTEVVQGRPTYKKRGKKLFLYYSTIGKWTIGSDTSDPKGNWKATSDAMTPDAITEAWQVPDMTAGVIFRDICGYLGSLTGRAWARTWVDVRTAKIMKRAAFETAAAQAAHTTANPAHRSTNTPTWTSSIMRKLASLLHNIAKAIDTDYCALTTAAAKATTTVNTAATDCPTPPREAGLESSPLQAPRQHGTVPQATTPPNAPRSPWGVDRRTWLGSAAAALILLGLLLPEEGTQQQQRGCTPPPATTCQAASPSATPATTCQAGSPSATTLLLDESATALQLAEALAAAEARLAEALGGTARLAELEASLATRQGSSTLA